MGNHHEYDSLDQCVLDIMANTDAPYEVAVLAAEYVYKDWYFDNSFEPRGVVISRDFNSPTGTKILLLRTPNTREI